MPALALALAGCGAERDRAPEGAAAGSWRTWVLRSPADVRVPPPARAAAAPRPSASAPARSPLEPWLEHVLAQVAARPKDPPAASRNYALVSVAMYDAIVAARHWQARYGEDDAASTYPSAEAALASAASTVIAGLYPSAPAAVLDRDAVEAGRALVAGGRATEQDVRAGEALGRAVAAEVMERARTDGADARLDPPRPRPPGSWAPPPGSAARPVQPGAGRWRTWLLRSGSELRAPAPPDLDSPAFVEQARAVMRAKEALTPRQKELAHFWEGGEGTELPPGIWIRVAMQRVAQERMDVALQARLFALLTVAMADAGVAAWDTKYTYWWPRPENAIRDLGLDPTWRPEVRTPVFPAYVSGHATYSAAAGEVLAHVFPQDAKRWRTRAKEAGTSRLWGGIHFPVDSAEGERMGLEIGRRAVQWARRDGAEAAR